MFASSCVTHGGKLHLARIYFRVAGEWYFTALLTAYSVSFLAAGGSLRTAGKRPADEGLEEEGERYRPRKGMLPNPFNEPDTAH